MAAGSTRLTAIASCSGSSSTSLKCFVSSISRPSNSVRNWSRRRSNGVMPVGWLSTLASIFLASSTSSPASTSRLSSVSRVGRSSHSIVVAEELTLGRGFVAREAAQRLGACLALGSDILIEALGDLDEQARQQVAVGLHVAQLTEHLLERRPQVHVLLLGFLVQRLRLPGEAIGEVAVELAHLIGELPDALFHRLALLPQRALVLLVGLGALILLLAELRRQRVQMLLGVRFERIEAARRLRLKVLEPLQESLLYLGKAPVIVLHLVAEQEIADLVHAHLRTKAGTISSQRRDDVCTG